MEIDRFKVERSSKREDVCCAIALLLACIASFLLAQLIATGALFAFRAFSQLMR